VYPSEAFHSGPAASPSRRWARRLSLEDVQAWRTHSVKRQRQPRAEPALVWDRALRGSLRTKNNGGVYCSRRERVVNEGLLPPVVPVGARQCRSARPNLPRGQSTGDDLGYPLSRKRFRRKLNGEDDLRLSIRKIHPDRTAVLFQVSRLSHRGYRMVAGASVSPAGASAPRASVMARGQGGGHGSFKRGEHSPFHQKPQASRLCEETRG